MKLSWILPLLYLIVAAVFGIFFGGAGHGSGIGILYWISFPASLLGELFPANSVMIWVAVAGFIQWLLIGLAAGLLSYRKKPRTPPKTP